MYLGDWFTLESSAIIYKNVYLEAVRVEFFLVLRFNNQGFLLQGGGLNKWSLCIPYVSSWRVKELRGDGCRGS